MFLSQTVTHFLFQAEELFSSPDVHPNDALVIVRELANATSESASTNRSQLPRDLITVSDIVAETVDLLLNSIQSNESKQVKEVNLNEVTTYQFVFRNIPWVTMYTPFVFRLKWC